MSEEKMEELKPCAWLMVVHGVPSLTADEGTALGWQNAGSFPVTPLYRRPSPVGRDLGSPQAGLGGPSSTPSDALEAAQRIVDFNPLHGDWDDAMCEDAEAVARALLAASPSPWRSMEEKADK